MKQPKNRKILHKERFLEGNRQRWAGMFVGIGLLVMVATSYGFLKDPAPFLGYFTGIGVTFILGASGSDIMKSYRIDSSTQNENEESERREYQESKREESIDSEITVKEGANAPELKPFGATANGDEEQGEYDDFQR